MEAYKKTLIAVLITLVVASCSKRPPAITPPGATLRPTIGDSVTVLFANLEPGIYHGYEIIDGVVSDEPFLWGYLPPAPKGYERYILNLKPMTGAPTPAEPVVFLLRKTR